LRGLPHIFPSPANLGSVDAIGDGCYCRRFTAFGIAQLSSQPRDIGDRGFRVPPSIPQDQERYEGAVRSFAWARVHEALGWRPGEPVSLGWSIVDRHAAEERTALLWLPPSGGERRVTYRELSEQSNRFANALRHLGVREGDRVAALMPRTPETLIGLLAVLKLGAIYVPIFTGFGPDAVRFRLEHSGARLLVTHHSVRDRVPADATAAIVCVRDPGVAGAAGDRDFWQLASSQSAVFAPILRARDEPAAIIYTSGSTGMPKGGAVAVNFLGAVWPYIVYGLGLRPDDRIWPTGDPGWGYGFVCYLGALALGATIVSMQANPTPESCLSVLETEGVTSLATTPTLLRSLMTLGEDRLRGRAPALRAISSCGEPLNAKVVDFFRNAWGLTPMDHFGATEFALPIGNFNVLAMDVKPGSMGRPMPGFRMAILDDAGNELPTDAVGLIGKQSDPDCRYWLRYWQDEEASRQLVRNGWIATGDLGRRDAAGYFWFEGRADDMIKSAGYRIGPFEVESALLKHPAVAEAAVVGKPDPIKGDIVMAYVVLRPGHTASPALAEELAEGVKRDLGSHQYPREIEFLDRLPKTETGKIQRFLLRQRLREGVR
jgi:acetyl-CoA synthetase